MIPIPVWKSYRSDLDYSYTLGAFPTFELLLHRPDTVQALLLHPSFAESGAGQRAQDFAASKKIPLQIESKAITRLSPKENIYLIAIFAKYEERLGKNSSHLLLDQPTNMGNVGTIMRSMLGFGVQDMGLLPPAVDPFDPRVIRASMGALFALRIEAFSSIEDYRAAYPRHRLYPLMLDGRYNLEEAPFDASPFSLILGSETSGLAANYHQLGHSIVIPHEAAIDSLNITVAAGIALESFYRRRKDLASPCLGGVI